MTVTTDSRYTYGLGLVGQFDNENTDMRYYDEDALGSIVGLSGVNGEYANAYSYLPFGEELSKIETLDNPFEYVGQFGVMHDASGLAFMRARNYSFEDGRFINADPSGIEGGNQPIQIHEQ